MLAGLNPLPLNHGFGVILACTSFLVPVHCATAFSMQSCAESAYQPYADEYC